MSTFSRIRTLFLGAAMLPAAAFADTLFFHDGSSLDGVVSQPNPNVYVLELDGGRMYFQVSEVSHWEENDRVGKYNLFTINPRQIAHEQARQEVTGLTGEEIEEMYRIMEPLASIDMNEVAAAKQALLAKADDIDLMRFLRSAMIDMTYKYLPATLEVMVELDPEGARDVLVDRSEDTFPENRSKALELLAKTAGADALDTLARGMVDLDVSVQTTAARALADAGDKRATPALLEGLKSTDQRVRNASEEALKALWSDDSGAAQASNAADWERLWSSRQARVERPIQVAGLTPLVSAEAKEAGLHYDE